MNERIKELAVQADLLIKKSNGDEFQYGNFDPKFQKFAELIVRECIDIAQDRAAFDCFPPNDVNHIIDEIREHFGVEL